MPPPSDLVGRRFGALVVLGPAPVDKHPRWLTRCDCGREEAYFQRRLVESSRRDRVEACSVCRATPCVICGAPCEGNRTTCSETCRRANLKAIYNASYHRRINDPERGPVIRAQRMVRAQREKAEKSAEERREIERRRAARRKVREEKDPTLRERRQRLHNARYAEHREAIQAARKAKLDAMAPQELAQWMERARGYMRAYAARKRSDPESHRDYLAVQAEYRRRRALAGLMAEAGQLTENRSDE